MGLPPKKERGVRTGGYGDTMEDGWGNSIPINFVVFVEMSLPNSAEFRVGTVIYGVGNGLLWASTVGASVVFV